MKYFSSDHHFYHKNIIKYCNRPFKDFKEMYHKMIEIWNSIVKEDDEVYYLGDLGMDLSEHQIEEIVRSLNGIKKIMVFGNHDGKHTKNINELFEQVLPFGKDAYVEIKGIEYRLNHLPFIEGLTEYDERFHDKAPIRKWGKERLLCGHVHNNVSWKYKDYMLNVGVDNWNFKPVSEDKIHEIFEKNVELLTNKIEYTKNN